MLLAAKLFLDLGSLVSVKVKFGLKGSRGDSLECIGQNERDWNVSYEFSYLL